MCYESRLHFVNGTHNIKQRRACMAELVLYRRRFIPDEKILLKAQNRKFSIKNI